MTIRTRRMMGVAALLCAATWVDACTREQPAEEARRPAEAQPSAGPAGAPPTDTTVSTAVQARYYTDDALRDDRISVASENGVVTLRGTVDTEAEKQKAMEIARSVEGVTRVDDQLTMQPERVDTGEAVADRAQPREKAGESAGTSGRGGVDLDAAWITTKIQAQYFVDSDVKARNIDVTTSGSGVVTLEGTVDSAEDKAKAVQIAQQTEGVMRVEDRLRVSAATAGAEKDAATPATTSTDKTVTPPDPWITAKIQAKYFIDDLVKGRHIDVDTSNGVVTLNGSLASEAERRQALALARNTDGVRNVTDRLQVDKTLAGKDAAGAPLPKVAPIDRPDPWVTTKIQSKYFLDADVKGHQIDVDTKSGVVTLKGTVASAELKQRAEQIARETEGVTRVINQLTVGTR